MPFTYQVLQTSRNFCFSGLFQCQCLHCGAVDVKTLGLYTRNFPTPWFTFVHRKLVEVIPQCLTLLAAKLFFFFFLLHLVLTLINVFGHLESCESPFPNAQSVLLWFKAGLPGFYDPCVGEEKSLKVLYQFRGVLHQVMSADNEALRIPKQCK